MAYLDVFLEFLRTLPDTLIYLLLGVSAFLENILPPIPGDTITAFGAFLVGTGRLGFVGVYVSTTVGSVAGFMALFWVGDRLGNKFFLEKDIRFFRAEKISRAAAWFQRYGYLLILSNRFFPGIRSAISIAGGASGLKYPLAGVLALVSSSVWNLIWIFLGYSLGNNWDTVKENLVRIMTRYHLVVLIAAGSVILLLLLRKLLRKNR